MSFEAVRACGGRKVLLMLLDEPVVEADYLIKVSEDMRGTLRAVEWLLGKPEPGEFVCE